MSGLIRDGALAEDAFVRIEATAPVPATGAVIVRLAHWQAERDALLARRDPLGLWLASDEHPEAIAADVARFALIALEFPRFRDGRAYTYARLLRERYGYTGELRAVGDVLPDQLHLMLRVGFNAFVLTHADPLGIYTAATQGFSVWYQPASDGRPTALELRSERSSTR